MSKLVQVFGDYGYDSEQLLLGETSLEDAERFIKRYTRGGDFGGYSVIEAISFADDGEAIVRFKVSIDD